jgi:peptidoglycan/LPS O-acetylase OafA/YrhL
MRPAALRPVVALLLVNLGLSILLTVVVFAMKNSIINYQLDHRHITDPDLRATLRDAYSTAIWTRAVGNVVVSVLYVFLVRALLRGRRWAYRRVILVGIAGIVGLAVLWATPYPAWMRVEQILQSLVLAALVYCVTRPDVREHFRTAPGANIRRFRHE